ncbi:MAG: Holliday junction branch migration protein RuvA [Leptospiraceae bacterium]
MISGIRGVVSRKAGTRLFIDTGAVEYEMIVPLNVLDAVERRLYQEPEAQLFFHVHQQILPEEHRLYGFLDPQQRELFRTIQDIKGFGSSLALSILSHLDTRGLLGICESGDTKGLTHIPRIGKSTAEALIFEVNRKKKRFLKLLELEEGAARAGLSEAGELVAEPEDETSELVKQALLQLGYKEAQVLKVLQKLEKERLAAEISGSDDNQLDAESSTADWIRKALQLM